MEIYLDNAATSHPKPDPVLKAVARAMTELNGNPGRSGHARALRGAMELVDCRETLSRLIGASDPMDVVFAFNCTDALNLAIKGSISRGDHVITTLLEHNSVLRPLMTLQDQGTIEVTLVAPEPDGFISPEAIKNQVRGNTRLCVVSHASNVIGAIQPVAAIGRLMRQAGIPFLVDGAQALGAQPVDVRALGCDMYAFPGHKGLLGPLGTGGLYIREGLCLNTLREGGTGSSSDSMRQPGERPERYESGTVNLHGIAGLNAGARYVMQNELTLRAHERALTDQLMKGLSAIEGVTVYGSPDARNRVGVVSFNVGDYASGAVADALDQEGYQVRGGLHCAPGVHEWLGTLERGAVRASIGRTNTAKEIDGFLGTVANIARKGL